jgi:hypothetical protein
MKNNKNFLRQGFNIKRGFLESPRAFMKETRIVCILHTDGRVTEHGPITDPWRYIAKAKKGVDVEDAWIKSE